MDFLLIQSGVVPVQCLIGLVTISKKPVSHYPSLYDTKTGNDARVSLDCLSVILKVALHTNIVWIVGYMQTFFFCRLLGRLVNASSCVVPRSATPYTLCLCGHVLLSQAFLLCLQEGKELMDLLIHLFTSWPSPLLLFFSLSPLTLTCILPTVWDLTANKPTISPSRGVIWHLAGMGAVHAEHRQDVCMFQTPFLCGPEGFRGIRVEVREMEGRWTDNEKLVLSGEGQRENKKEKVKVQGCLLVVCVCKYTCTIHTLVPVWSTRKFNLASKQRIDCHWLYHASTSKKRLQINI